jgi:hypothetical protein
MNAAHNSCSAKPVRNTSGLCDAKAVLALHAPFCDVCCRALRSLILNA